MSEVLEKKWGRKFGIGVGTIAVFAILLGMNIYVAGHVWLSVALVAGIAFTATACMFGLAGVDMVVRGVKAWRGDK